MASNLLPVTPIVIRASASTDPRPDNNRRKKSSGSTNWWNPLFGVSSEPDYIGSETKADDVSDMKEERSESDLDLKQAKSSRFPRGRFTEEKAKQLRMLTNDTSSFHDVMYHSAIASRLASDFKRQSDL